MNSHSLEGLSFDRLGFDRNRFDREFARIYRYHMPQEAQSIQHKYMAMWQIPAMKKMTFGMADVVNRRILDGPLDEKESRHVAR
jgi:hypothetical protein